MERSLHGAFYAELEKGKDSHHEKLGNAILSPKVWPSGKDRFWLIPSEKRRGRVSFSASS